MTSTPSLKVKRALVTGGSRGIGAAIARRPASQGAAVAGLTQDGHLGTTYELGGTPFTLTALSATISDVLGTHIAYQDMSVSDHNGVLTGSGLQGWVRQRRPGYRRSQWRIRGEAAIPGAGKHDPLHVSGRKVANGCVAFNPLIRLRLNPARERMICAPCITSARDHPGAQNRHRVLRTALRTALRQGLKSRLAKAQTQGRPTACTCRRPPGSAANRHGKTPRPGDLPGASRQAATKRRTRQASGMPLSVPRDLPGGFPGTPLTNLPEAGVLQSPQAWVLAVQRWPSSGACSRPVVWCRQVTGALAEVLALRWAGHHSS
jgi:hypothetical protein